MNGVAIAIASWFGCGYFPYGPGSVGSLAAILIALLLHAYGGRGQETLLILILLLLVPAIWASTQAERLLQKKDPSTVVVDEVLGQWVTLMGATALKWQSFCAAFVLFRLFDIWKPWPVRMFEKLRGGLGIVADDLAAGLYGALILYICGEFRLY